MQFVFLDLRAIMARFFCAHMYQKNVQISIDIFDTPDVSLIM